MRDTDCCGDSSGRANPKGRREPRAVYSSPSATVVDAGWGALVTLALSVFPFSSVVGGAVAANRHGGGYRSGLRLGTLAGVAAMIPLLLLFVPSLVIAGLLGFGIPPSSPGYGLFLALVFAFFLVYTVGLSALGGLGGAWASANTDWDLDPVRWL